ncbi:MAG: putative zinc-binding metallopeptidase [Kiritimatiellae bacterium]|nr:putative zinc-binding metallopeptidase [Kiritimatiellia bacterium]
MAAAARMRSVINAWETVRFELMNTRIRDLPLRIERSPVAPSIARLKNEFAAKGITFEPRFYLTDSWGCPNEVPVIGIPFYLADKRLARIEEEQTGEIEDDDTIMMLLRHEGGHAVNYAYRLWLDREWAQVFGSFTKPYRDAFSPDPFSRQFVRHLAHGQYHRTTYAQKHPDEDFAETFAIWLTPGSRWRSRYSRWPALRKLEYVARLMRRCRIRQPLVTGGELLEPVEEIPGTLADHYGQRLERYRAAAQGYVDDKLREIFPTTRSFSTTLPAHLFLTRRRRALTSRIARWSNMSPEDIAMILAKLYDRSKALGLRMYPRREDAYLLDITALVTTMATRFGLLGRFDISDF